MTKPSRVYISSSATNEILAFELDSSSGRLTPIQIVSLASCLERDLSKIDVKCLPMAISANRRFLYIALRYAQPQIGVFAIEPSGQLRFLGTGPSIYGAVYLTTDKTDRVLLGASHNGSLIMAHPLESDGRLRTGPGQIVFDVLNAHSIKIDPTNRFVYAPLLGEDVIACFPLDLERRRIRWTAPLKVPFLPGVGPRHFTFHPNGRFLYANTEQGGTVVAFNVDAVSGRLIELQSIGAMPPGFGGISAAADLHITPDGKHLYSSERSKSLIVGFSVDPDTGLLSLPAHYPTEKNPRSFAIDPSGRFLISCGLKSHHVMIHGIDSASGKLTDLNRSSDCKAPGWIEIVGQTTGDNHA